MAPSPSKTTILISVGIVCPCSGGKVIRKESARASDFVQYFRCVFIGAYSYCALPQAICRPRSAMFGDLHPLVGPSVGTNRYFCPRLRIIPKLFCHGGDAVSMTSGVSAG